MFVDMAMAVIQGKEIFAARTWELAIHVQNILKGGTQLNVIYARQKHLKCNYLNYVESRYNELSNISWQCYNCSEKIAPIYINK